jgi:large subunit ribosomal protein L25
MEEQEMSKELMVDVASRGDAGKNVSRRLRRDGIVPAVVYGMNRPVVPVTVDRKVIAGILTSEGGENTVLQLRLDGQDAKKRHVMIREMQKDPVDGSLLHVDFLRVDMEKKVNVEVPLETVGLASGVKNEGAFMDFVVRTVQVSCLPGVIPGHLEIDVTPMNKGDVFRAGDLPLGDGVELLTDTSQALVVVSGRVEEEEAVAEAEVAEEAEAAAAEEGKPEETPEEEKKE